MLNGNKYKKFACKRDVDRSVRCWKTKTRLISRWFICLSLTNVTFETNRSKTYFANKWNVYVKENCFRISILSERFSKNIDRLVFGKIRLQDAVTKLLSLPEQPCESEGFSSSTNVAFELSHEWSGKKLATTWLHERFLEWTRVIIKTSIMIKIFVLRSSDVKWKLNKLD